MRRSASQTILLFPGVSCRVRRNNRSRRIRLTIRNGGEVTLSLPRLVSFVSAKRFLEEKREWILAALKRSVNRPSRLLSEGGKEEYAAMKETARKRITARVEHFCAIYGVTYRALSIRNQKSRFGSCSGRRHLSFNYRLIFLPQILLDYVVVHEVCHLEELNHSRKFWALVARTVPDYRERKRELQAFSRSVS